MSALSFYLAWIGCANALGVGLLVGALHEGFADGLLRRWTRMIPPDEPYRHSPYGRVWLWWAIIGTGFFAALNFVALGWPPAYARVIAWGNVYCYGSFELLAIAASLSPRWGAGVRVAHVLWIGQTGWGVWALLR